MNDKPKIRCAIYTRKSHEDGLEQEFNSLHAQRESGENYINSQKHAGWVALPELYDDGGFSGGNIERPALKKLFEDIEKGLVDVVVVYKIDRLSRSIADFVKMVEFFEKYSVTYVSVTQNFNTQNSMGKLMLNILLSFAQFEREVTSERIRDKIAASKAKGMWTGGYPPLGYDCKERKLQINTAEAEIVRFMFERYCIRTSLLKVAKDLKEKGYRSKRRVSEKGNEFGGSDIGAALLYKMLNNPIYIGKIRHKDKVFEGMHQPIISKGLWDKVQNLLPHKSPTRAISHVREKTGISGILKGIIFDIDGNAMTPSFTRKKDKLYRYYVNSRALKHGYEGCSVKSVPAEEVENFLIAKIRELVTTPEITSKIYMQARKKDSQVTLDYIRDSMKDFDHIWNHLFPLEKSRIVQLIVKRITVAPHGIHITFHPSGLLNLCEEIMPHQQKVA